MERHRSSGRLRPPPAGESGFSLIELMVVVLIIAVLMGIAIPVFLGLRTRSQDRVAQATVSAAHRVERGFYEGAPRQFTDDVADLEFFEPALDYEGSGADTCTGFDDPICVQVTLISPDEVLLVVRSASGSYWAIRDRMLGAGQGTYYNRGGSPLVPVAVDITDDGW